MTIQLHIQLEQLSDPAVWRCVTVPSEFTFYQLHNIIQAAFGWEYNHPFEFQATTPDGKLCIGDPSDRAESNAEVKSAEEVQLGDLFKTAGYSMVYVYDFESNWVHRIMLEKIGPKLGTTADCLAGEGVCPPEDCGGVEGYQHLKQALADQQHPDHQRSRDRLGLERQEVWDAAKFDPNEVRKEISLC